MSCGGEMSRISARYPKDRWLRVQRSIRDRKTEKIVADCVVQFAAGNGVVAEPGVRGLLGEHNRYHPL